MIGALRILFPTFDRRSSERFRDTRVKDSVANSEQVLARHIAVAREVAAIEARLLHRSPDPRAKPDTHR